MKLIEIYNKIANGEEVPEKIQVYNDVFIFDYSNMAYEHEKTKTNLLSIYNGYILNYEVSIIEKDKKIKELPTNDGMVYATDGEMTLVVNKINEIIDKINKMEV